MERENMAPGLFAESISIQQSTLSHLLSGRNNPSLDVIMKIHQKYNYINLEWLLYGKGELSNQTRTDPNNPESQPLLFNENSIIPSNRQASAENRKEIGLRMTEMPLNETINQEIKYIEKPVRKITEIRIFFDDNTYETFKGEKQ